MMTAAITTRVQKVQQLVELEDEAQIVTETDLQTDLSIEKRFVIGEDDRGMEDEDEDDDDNKLELGEFGEVNKEVLPLLLFAMAGVVAVAVDDVIAVVDERDRGSLIHWTMMGWLSWVSTLAPCFLCGDNIIVVVVVSVCSFLSVNLLLCF